MKPLDQIDEIPVYHRSDRLQVTNPKGPFQEVMLKVHTFEEIDSEEFREFLKRAMESYLELSSVGKLDLKELTPWKQLGRKWHLSRKGFPSNRRVAWTVRTLELLFDLLEEIVSETVSESESEMELQTDWGNKSVVHFRLKSKKAARSASIPWASIHTKRRRSIDLQLSGQEGSFAFGRIAEFGRERELKSGKKGTETIQIKFTTQKQINDAELRTFLKEHLEQVFSP